jgi:hypothetical protein
MICDTATLVDADVHLAGEQGSTDRGGRVGPRGRLHRADRGAPTPPPKPAAARADRATGVSATSPGETNPPLPRGRSQQPAGCTAPLGARRKLQFRPRARRADRDGFRQGRSRGEPAPPRGRRRPTTGSIWSTRSRCSRARPAPRIPTAGPRNRSCGSAEVAPSVSRLPPQPAVRIEKTAFFCTKSNRGGEIRTLDLLVPNQIPRVFPGRGSSGPADSFSLTSPAETTIFRR